MRPLSYDHTTAVGLLCDQMDAFVMAAESFSGYDLLGASRMHGWSRLEAVPQLDLGDEAGHPTADSLQAVRRTVEAIADVDLPDTWSDKDTALIALGRVPMPDHAEHLADRLPISL